MHFSAFMYKMSYFQATAKQSSKKVRRVCANTFGYCMLLVNLVQVIGVLCMRPLVYVIPIIHSCSITCCVVALPQCNMLYSKPGLLTRSICVQKEKVFPKLDSKSLVRHARTLLSSLLYRFLVTSSPMCTCKMKP